MVKRRYKPIITYQSVAAALDRLLYGHADESIIRSLYRLSIVEDVLTDRDFPPAENSLAHEYALNRVLVDLIFTGYADRRQQINYAPPILNTSYADTCEIVIEDGQSEIDDIRSWSYFYHRYVRADLDISKERYSHLLGVSARQLQRLEQVAFRQFIQLLVDSEWVSRQLQLQRHLRAQIPVSNTNILVERDTIIDDIIMRLTSHPANCIHVTGETGTGKTALCHHVATHLIEHNHLDYVLWLNNVSDPEIVYDAIWQLRQGRRIGGQETIRIFLQQHRCLIVLDNLSCKPGHALDNLLADLRFATVLMTSTADIPMAGQIYRVHLNNLSSLATRELVEKLSSDELDYNQDAFYRATQGNPAQIYRHMYELITAGTLSSDIASLYRNLTPAQKHLCIALACHFQGRANRQQVQFFGHVTEADLSYLVENHLIFIIDETTYQLSPELNQHIIDTYLFQQLDTGHEYEIIEKLLSGSANTENHTILLPLAEHLLNRYKNIFNDSDYVLLLNRFCRIALKSGNIFLWERILRPYCTSETMQLYLVRCICLRYLGHWDEALLVLDKCLSASGQKGWFKYQAEILLEIAIIKRNQGDYSAASILLQRSLATSKRYSQVLLQSRIMREIAQIALDMEDVVKVRQFLSQPDLFDEQPTLYAELLLINEQYNACAQIVDVALKDVESTYDRALLLSIKGRCQYQRHYYKEALVDFMDALADFEIVQDLFAITRTKVQIAGVLISMGDFERSEDILIECLDVQAELKDAAGLTATRHNLNILTHLQAHSGMT